MMLGGYLSTEAAPMHMTPVDHGAAMFVALAITVTTSGAADIGGGGSADDAAAPLIWHLPLTLHSTAGELMVQVSAASVLEGRRMRRFEPEQWRRSLDDLPPNNPMYAFKGGFRDSGLGGLPPHRHDATDTQLGQAVQLLQTQKRAAFEQLNALALSVAEARSREGAGYTQEEVRSCVAYINATSTLHGDKPLLRRTLSGGPVKH